MRPSVTEIRLVQDSLDVCWKMGRGLIQIPAAPTVFWNYTTCESVLCSPMVSLLHELGHVEDAAQRPYLYPDCKQTNTYPTDTQVILREAAAWRYVLREAPLRRAEILETARVCFGSYLDNREPWAAHRAAVRKVKGR